MILSVAIQFIFFVVAIALKYDNITNDIFPIKSGIIAAFGHFNSDEYTDVFSLQKYGHILQIFLGSEKKQQFQLHVNCSFKSTITSVVPGDFNGDSQMDVLITLLPSSDSSEVDIRILWGLDGNIDCKAGNLFSIVNQPIVVDFNGDMIPDIIGDTKSEGRYVWFYSNEKKFINMTLPGHQKFRNPHSSGLIDMNGDLAADMLVLGEENIEVWNNIGDRFEYQKHNVIHYPNSLSKYNNLQVTFVDLNLDAELDIIMPVCDDAKCDHSYISVWNKNLSKWDLAFDNFKYQNETWGFKLPKGSPFDIAVLPVTLRAGDIDMDGYPDFLTVLESKSTNHKSRPVILKNNPCINCSNCIFDRCFEVIWDIPGLQDIPNLEIMAFFDIFEDGILDILASSRDHRDHEWKMHALKYSGDWDSCFMKVLVLSGLCNNCSTGRMAYGVNQPGPIVRYNMTTQEGHPVVSCAVQISQTAFFPLHLPYSLFGLGQTPNFLDALMVAVPAKFNRSVHKREWTQIIPNSQIVVIPHPPQEENKWVKKLYVTPSHYVMLTGIALVGTCVFISLIVAFLHWRERKEDKKEKMQDAYRFHFDAM